jgi:hypothetical protein
MTSVNGASLLETNGPAFLMIGCTHSDLTNLAWKLQRTTLAPGVVRFIRGKKLRTEQGLFDELSAALQFPYYFGENWDALSECINDLEWLPAKAYLLVITDALLVLTGEPATELATFARILKRTCTEWRTGRIEGQPWDTPPTPFSVLLHCLPGEEEQLAQWFGAMGLDLAKLDIDEHES